MGYNETRKRSLGEKFMQYMGRMIEFQRRNKEIMEGNSDFAITKFIMQDNVYICRYTTYKRFIEKPKNSLISIFLEKLSYRNRLEKYETTEVVKEKELVKALSYGDTKSMVTLLQELQTAIHACDSIYLHTYVNVLSYLQIHFHQSEEFTIFMMEQCLLSYPIFSNELRIVIDYVLFVQSQRGEAYSFVLKNLHAHAAAYGETTGFTELLKHYYQAKDFDHIELERKLKTIYQDNEHTDNSFLKLHILYSFLQLYQKNRKIEYSTTVAKIKLIVNHLHYSSCHFLDTQIIKILAYSLFVNYNRLDSYALFQLLLHSSNKNVMNVIYLNIIEYSYQLPITKINLQEYKEHFTKLDFYLTYYYQEGYPYCYEKSRRSYFIKKIIPYMNINRKYAPLIIEEWRSLKGKYPNHESQAEYQHYLNVLHATI